jgi:uncharacterized protein (TIGR02246 family)
MMDAAQERAHDEAQIRQLVENWAKAVRAKDIDGIMAHHAPDILLFDAIPPLQFTGGDAYRKNWEQCFPYFQGPIGCEIRDMSITAGADVAFCHSLTQINGTTTSGEHIATWLRATICFRKIDGKWTVTHEHVSVPFDPESGQASIDLKP